jgi:hypothetical protein
LLWQHAVRRSLLLCALLFGCEHSDLGFGNPPSPDDPPPPLMPGDQAWSDTNVACKTTADCGTGEACVDSICQMQRCAGDNYHSTAPIGKNRVFFNDREYLVGDSSSSSLNSYDPISGSSMGSWPTGGGAVLDVAGGKFFGVRPESFAIAVAGDSTVRIKDALGTEHDIDVGFVPIAITAGDTDADGTDELIAVGDGGRFAVCQTATSVCTPYSKTLNGNPSVFLDVAAGDTNNDGADEILFLEDAGNGGRALASFDLNSSNDGLPQFITSGFSGNYTAITAGDMDGDGVVEVAVLENGGYAGLASDTAHIYQVTGSGWAERTTVTLDGDTLDIAIGDTNADHKAELVALHNGTIRASGLEIFGWGDSGIQSLGTMAVPGTRNGNRISMADLDGDSPSGTLVDGPVLISGKAIPTTVVTFPPYDKEHSQGVGDVDVGDSRSTSTSLSDTVSLTLGAELGVDLGVPGTFTAAIQGSYQKTWQHTHGVGQTLSVGNRIIASPQTDIHGFKYGGVVMSCGCYHRYTYVLSDPAGKIGGDGKQMAVMVPVGGQTTLWSTPRYNAMAQAVGDLPQVNVPMTIGDPTSYPTVPTTLDGQPIPSNDMVFPDPPLFTVSDAASVGWSLSTGTSTTNDDTTSTAIGVGVSFGIAGLVSVGVSENTSSGSSYSVTVGKDVSFSGSVPPLPDNPNTPADEYKQFGFSFKPVVYRQHYTDGDGNDAAFYVITYVVQK